jgi:hypothetical protein
MMDSLRPLIRPTDLPHGRRYQFADGTEATTDDVFDSSSRRVTAMSRR